MGVEDFVTDEITGINLYTFADRVKTKLQQIGIGDQSQRPRLEEDHRGIFPGLKPGDYFNGRLPVVIRKLTLDQLSALYSLFASWYSYLTFQTGLIAAERSEALRQKEFLWSHVRKQHKFNADGSKNTDQVMSDLARGDYRFVTTFAKYSELNAIYECMVSTLEVAEQDMKMISREVTINQAKMAKEYMGSGGGADRTSRGFRPWVAGKREEGEGDSHEADTQEAPEQVRPLRRGPGPTIKVRAK
jgi:hypothetical protein